MQVITGGDNNGAIIKAWSDDLDDATLAQLKNTARR